MQLQCSNEPLSNGSGKANGELQGKSLIVSYYLPTLPCGALYHTRGPSVLKLCLVKVFEKNREGGDGGNFVIVRYYISDIKIISHSIF